ncbi:MAG: tRNA glutamyl-Q(34) synthetase GluQRS [Rhodocyclaceae bacterium]|nr:tRNA glutamyl-Q(34) synthetase GluQRS [Rhodocyclaceae bacterium]
MPATPKPAGEDYVGRFAPSPTGPLHFGSLVAALASYLDARANNGQWLVRIEDVDETRCDASYADAILATLDTFGLDWDGEVIVQSRRKARYQEVLATLEAAGQTYHCECSRKEIADSAVMGIDGPVYPGTCRHKNLPAHGAAIRFASPAGAVEFEDRLQGKQIQNVERAVGDFVIRRRDGLAAYQLAVVVDDFDSGITDIVRGADLLDSTARQIVLQRALGYPTPRYLHFPVVSNNDGEKLSKQTLAAPVATGDRIGVLRGALHFLRQPEIQRVADCRQLLAAAVANWQPETISRSRSLVFPDKT